MIHVCDTGPLVAFLNRNDPHHARSVALMRRLPAPLLSCEAVLTEAACFLREDGLCVDALFALIERGVLRLDFDLRTHWPRLRTLMARYERMDLADACIVAITEQHRQVRVLTVDRRDFSAYRRNDRQVIAFVAPPAD
jgi:predicted nucleic acid-binding protein